MKPRHATYLKLLQTAERLFAEHGVDAVSLRTISAEAGQRNNSALQYHFGSKEQLLQAILEYRMAPLDVRREQLIDNLRERGRHNDLDALVHALVLPYAELLGQPAADSYYLAMMAQLESQQRHDLTYRDARVRSRVLTEFNKMITAALALTPSQWHLAYALVASTLLHTLARWDHERREQNRCLSAAEINHRVAVLADFITAGLRSMTALLPAGIDDAT